ncbi:MAG: hypothetical protein V4506_09145 [Bacteroidota bacterium]
MQHLFIPLFLFVLCACHETPKAAMSQSYELSLNGKDTINLVDGNGQKQGLWITHGKTDSTVYLNGTGHTVDSTFTSGEVIRLLQKKR